MADDRVIYERAAAGAPTATGTIFRIALTDTLSPDGVCVVRDRLMALARRRRAHETTSWSVSRASAKPECNW